MKPLINQTDTVRSIRIPQDVYRGVEREVERWRAREGVGNVNAWIVQVLRERLGRGEPAEAGGGGQKSRTSVGVLREELGEALRRDEARENPITGRAVTVPVGEAGVLEHAARAEPGFGKSVTEHLLKNGVGGEVSSEEPADEIDFTEGARPWFPELKKIEGREDAAELFADLLGGKVIRPPKGWMQMTIQKRATWLDANHPLGVK